MTQLTNDAILGQLTTLLHEAFEGAPGPWSYFLDHGPEHGLFGTLATMSAAEASREAAGSSVAAQVYHLAYSVRAAAGWLRGERVKHDWSQSWVVRTVDEAAWARLRDELRAGHAELRRAFEAHGTASAEEIGAAAGAVAHSAYHLGAIRQKLAFLRGGPPPAGAAAHPPPP
jgi:hypothetical protein